MFTGIVTDVGRVRAVEDAAVGRRLTIATALDLADVALGASIACNGCCLTVVAKGADWFAADASGETLDCTTLGDWREGRAVNLERPLCVGDELGGHIVQGHVDGVATLEDIEPEGDNHRLTLAAPADLARFIAPKGSATLDGVSLTVNEVDGSRFGVNIIPHTWAATAFAETPAASAVNLEIDVLARYAARLMEAAGQ